ncbi:MAG: biotin/lipoyl-containing protein, partial [Planctomycetota bacterium]
MALKEFKLPDIGEGIAEGEIVSWKVQPGQTVKEEDEFVEVMTDKATVMITAPCDGVVKELKAKEGDIVPVESVIAVFELGGAGAAAPAPAEAAPGPAPAAA